MIDAYEIGIQLALQDGVSAGLQVIGRELSALDQAVAGTAGRLEMLTRTAEAAGRAVAAVGVGPVPAAAVAAEVPAAGPGGTPVAAAAAREAGPVAVAAVAAPVVERVGVAPPGPVVRETVSARAGVAPPVVVTAAAPSVRVAVAPALVPGAVIPVIAAPAALAAAPVVQREIVERAGPAGPTAVMVAEARAVAPGPAVEPRAMAPAAQAAEVRAAPVLAPVVGAAAAPVAVRVLEQGAGFAAAVREPVGSVAPVVPGVVAAVMPPFDFGRDAVAPKEPAAFLAGSMPAAPGGELLGGASAAPPERSGEEARGGGDVMLDGQLVGHWLAERMGRDAGRPAAGTTFFDARQAPAWAPSGAL